MTITKFKSAGGFDANGNLVSNIASPLSNTDATNKSYVDVLVSQVQTTASNAIPLSQKGVANGVATLDSSGLVPAAQLPSYVDDVVEVPSFSDLPAVGEPGKIYVTLDTNYIYRWSGSSYIRVNSTVSSAETATKLANARTISLTGDATWSVLFDGSANATNALVLSNSGVTAGTYAKVTVDTKGRVTVGSSLVASDIPNLDTSKITTGILGVNRGGTGVGEVTGLIKGNGTAAFSAATPGTDYVVPSGSITGNAATATKLATARSISSTGDVSWTVSSFDGSANVSATATLSSTGVSPGEYTKVTVDSKGRITSATLITSQDIIQSLGVNLSAITYVAATTSAQTADATTLASARTIKYIAQVSNGSSYQSSEILVVHDGASAYVTEYAVIATGNTLAAFDADILSGNVRLRVTPALSNTTIKLVKTIIN